MISEEFFLIQMTRLRTRFGEKAFDREMTRLIAQEVKTMSEAGLRRAIDVMIGSKPAHLAPLLAEFREARLAEERNRFNNETQAAAKALRRAPEEMRSNIRSLLDDHYDGASSLKDALEIARRKIKKNPNESGAK